MERELNLALRSYQQLMAITTSVLQKNREDYFLNISVRALDSALSDKRNKFAAKVVVALQNNHYFLLTYLGAKEAWRTTQTNLFFENWGIIFLLKPDCEFELLGNVFLAEASKFERVPVLNIKRISAFKQQGKNAFGPETKGGVTS